MGKTKGGAAAASKKPKAKPKQRGGVDFKKYKHKVGRKLPPPKNTTNTEIKFKMIVLPEQSMASERAGMAVNKRGLTLRELLQQTVHYNPKVRRAALNGIKDLVTKHPAELKLHKVAMIEKLQERICDSDKVVRESLYTILQSLIFPSLKEAFNNFVAVLSNDRIHLQDKSKLNSVLAGLGHCLSLVARATENDDASNRPVHNLSTKELWKPTLDEDNSGSSTFATSDVLTKLQNLIQILVNSIEVSASEICAKPANDAPSSEALLSALHCLDLIFRTFVREAKKPQMEFGRTKTLYGPDWLNSSVLVYLKKLWGVKRLFHEKAKVLRNKDLMETHLGPLITCIPGLISNAADDSKGYLLEEKSGITFTEHDSGISEYHSTWINELPGILLQSVDKAPTVTKVVLELLLRIGQYFPTLECENLRPIAQLFGTKFMFFPVEVRGYSNLCNAVGKLEPLILFRIVEVLQSTYKAGNLQITEQLSFLSLLMARFDVNHVTGTIGSDGDKTS
ncbi:hypothetical protein ACQ4PT_067848 [Festuca glaucescens]